MTIPPSSNPKLEPVSCLNVYIQRTARVRPQETRPVFLTCNKPHHANTAPTVSKVLNDAIQLAGLDTGKFSVKMFRPSAEKAAVESGVDPTKARA